MTVKLVNNSPSFCLAKFPPFNAILPDSQSSEFAREYYLITRNDRLEKVAADIVTHFLGREQRGKAMVICIDKLTAVKMYNKVQTHWQAHLNSLKTELTQADELRQRSLKQQIDYLETTDMAIVISQQQNEVDYFQTHGLDITPHRQRIVKEDLAKKFQDPTDPFRLVFVCAMWLTGFDAPSVSTIYLDKPMKNHTLMQTIARANRVWGEKNNGLIVDYVGVFRDLQKALAIYGTASGGGINPGECPIQKKEELVAALRQAIEAAQAFCTERGVNLDHLSHQAGFQRTAFLDDAAAQLVDKSTLEGLDDSVEKIILNDDLKRQFIFLAGQVTRLYKAILPDPHSSEFAPITTCLAYLAKKIRAFLPPANIDDIMGQVEDLLDQSITAEGYTIPNHDPTALIDLSQIDFDALQAHFASSRKHTEAEKLRRLLNRKLSQMVQLNQTRTDLMEKFKALIEDYNQGQNVELFFAHLMAFAKELNTEDQRAIAEQLTEEELAIFDILMKPALDMTPNDRQKVKDVARTLLQTLKQAKLVLDWRKKQRTVADVRVTVEKILDDGLPRIYTTDLYKQKCTTIFQHIYDHYSEAGKSTYDAA